MFSFYENMPCVVLEALCTGIPVIATTVGGIPEIIGKENGILINPGKERELLNAMKEMIRNYHLYDADFISRQATEQFSYEVVGKEISDIYQSVLK
jgi:glycosyltransferase involved in cell wall biosynthesis